MPNNKTTPQKESQKLTKKAKVILVGGATLIGTVGTIIGVTVGSPETNPYIDIILPQKIYLNQIDEKYQQINGHYFYQNNQKLQDLLEYHHGKQILHFHLDDKNNPRFIIFNIVSQQNKYRFLSRQQEEKIPLFKDNTLYNRVYTRLNLNLSQLTFEQALENFPINPQNVISYPQFIDSKVKIQSLKSVTLEDHKQYLEILLSYQFDKDITFFTTSTLYYGQFNATQEKIVRANEIFTNKILIDKNLFKNPDYDIETDNLWNLYSNFLYKLDIPTINELVRNHIKIKYKSKLLSPSNYSFSVDPITKNLITFTIGDTKLFLTGNPSSAINTKYLKTKSHKYEDLLNTLVSQTQLPAHFFDDITFISDDGNNIDKNSSYIITDSLENLQVDTKNTIINLKPKTALKISDIDKQLHLKLGDLVRVQIDSDQDVTLDSSQVDDINITRARDIYTNGIPSYPISVSQYRNLQLQAIPLLYQNNQLDLSEHKIINKDALVPPTRAMLYTTLKGQFVDPISEEDLNRIANNLPSVKYLKLNNNTFIRDQDGDVESLNIIPFDFQKTTIKGDMNVTNLKNRGITSITNDGGNLTFKTDALEGNPLTSINIRGDKLKVESNGLNLETLKHANFEYNKVHIKSQGLPKTLETLTFGNNGDVTLERGFGASNVQTLDLSQLKSLNNNHFTNLFNEESALTSLSLPPSITDYSEDAFSLTPHLQTLAINNTTPLLDEVQKKLLDGLKSTKVEELLNYTFISKISGQTIKLPRVLIKPVGKITEDVIKKYTFDNTLDLSLIDHPIELDENVLNRGGDSQKLNLYLSQVAELPKTIDNVNLFIGETGDITDTNITNSNLTISSTQNISNTTLDDNSSLTIKRGKNIDHLTSKHVNLNNIESITNSHLSGTIKTKSIDHSELKDIIIYADSLKNTKLGGNITINPLNTTLESSNISFDDDFHLTLNTKLDGFHNVTFTDQNLSVVANKLFTSNSDFTLNKGDVDIIGQNNTIQSLRDFNLSSTDSTIKNSQNIKVHANSLLDLNSLTLEGNQNISIDGIKSARLSSNNTLGTISNSNNIQLQNFTSSSLNFIDSTASYENHFNNAVFANSVLSTTIDKQLTSSNLYTPQRFGDFTSMNVGTFSGQTYKVNDSTKKLFLTDTLPQKRNNTSFANLTYFSQNLDVPQIFSNSNIYVINSTLHNINTSNVYGQNSTLENSIINSSIETPFILNTGTYSNSIFKNSSFSKVNKDVILTSNSTTPIEFNNPILPILKGNWSSAFYEKQYLNSSDNLKVSNLKELYLDGQLIGTSEVVPKLTLLRDFGDKNQINLNSKIESVETTHLFVDNINQNEIKLVSKPSAAKISKNLEANNLNFPIEFKNTVNIVVKTNENFNLNNFTNVNNVNFINSTSSPIEMSTSVVNWNQNFSLGNNINVNFDNKPTTLDIWNDEFNVSTTSNVKNKYQRTLKFGNVLLYDYGTKKVNESIIGEQFINQNEFHIVGDNTNIGDGDSQNNTVKFDLTTNNEVLIHQLDDHTNQYLNNAIFWLNPSFKVKVSDNIYEQFKGLNVSPQMIGLWKELNQKRAPKIFNLNRGTHLKNYQIKKISTSDNPISINLGESSINIVDFDYSWNTQNVTQDNINTGSQFILNIKKDGDLHLDLTNLSTSNSEHTTPFQKSFEILKQTYLNPELDHIYQVNGEANQIYLNGALTKVHLKSPKVHLNELTQDVLSYLTLENTEKIYTKQVPTIQMIQDLIHQGKMYQLYLDDVNSENSQLIYKDGIYNYNTFKSSDFNYTFDFRLSKFNGDVESQPVMTFKRTKGKNILDIEQLDDHTVSFFTQIPLLPNLEVKVPSNSYQDLIHGKLQKLIKSIRTNNDSWTLINRNNPSELKRDTNTSKWMIFGNTATKDAHGNFQWDFSKRFLNNFNLQSNSSKTIRDGNYTTSLDEIIKWFANTFSTTSTKLLNTATYQHKNTGNQVSKITLDTNRITGTYRTPSHWVAGNQVYFDLKFQRNRWYHVPNLAFVVNTLKSDDVGRGKNFILDDFYENSKYLSYRNKLDVGNDKKFLIDQLIKNNQVSQNSNNNNFFFNYQDEYETGYQSYLIVNNWDNISDENLNQIKNGDFSVVDFSYDSIAHQDFLRRHPEIKEHIKYKVVNITTSLNLIKNELSTLNQSDVIYLDKNSLTSFYDLFSTNFPVVKKSHNFYYLNQVRASSVGLTKQRDSYRENYYDYSSQKQNVTFNILNGLSSVQDGYVGAIDRNYGVIDINWNGVGQTPSISLTKSTPINIVQMSGTPVKMEIPGNVGVLELSNFSDLFKFGNTVTEINRYINKSVSIGLVAPNQSNQYYDLKLNRDNVSIFTFDLDFETELKYYLQHDSNLKKQLTNLSQLLPVDFQWKDGIYKSRNSRSNVYNKQYVILNTSNPQQVFNYLIPQSNISGSIYVWDNQIDWNPRLSYKFSQRQYNNSVGFEIDDSSNVVYGHQKLTTKQYIVDGLPFYFVDVSNLRDIDTLNNFNNSHSNISSLNKNIFIGSQKNVRISNNSDNIQTIDTTSPFSAANQLLSDVNYPLIYNPPVDQDMTPSSNINGTDNIITFNPYSIYRRGNFFINNYYLQTSDYHIPKSWINDPNLPEYRDDNSEVLTTPQFLLYKTLSPDSQFVKAGASLSQTIPYFDGGALFFNSNDESQKWFAYLNFANTINFHPVRSISYGYLSSSKTIKIKNPLQEQTILKDDFLNLKYKDVRPQGIWDQNNTSNDGTWVTWPLSNESKFLFLNPGFIKNSFTGGLINGPSMYIGKNLTYKEIIQLHNFYKNSVSNNSSSMWKSAKLNFWYDSANIIYGLFAGAGKNTNGQTTRFRNTYVYFGANIGRQNINVTINLEEKHTQNINYNWSITPSQIDSILSWINQKTSNKYVGTVTRWNDFGDSK